VCEDSASTELSVTEIASAMSEINYILDEIKNMPEDDSPFLDADADYGGGMDKLGSAISELSKMPATLEELKDILSKFDYFLILLVLFMKN
jgi:hypothetical protein